MPRNLRSNHKAPNIFPFLQEQPIKIMAAVVPVVPPVVAPTDIWKANPYTGDFNPGTAAGQM